MPEPMVNSSRRRKKEFTFILVSQCGTHSFPLFIALLYAMLLILVGFAPLCVGCHLHCPVIKLLTYLNGRILSQTEVSHDHLQSSLVLCI